jgi:hypothetical protein
MVPSCELTFSLRPNCNLQGDATSSAEFIFVGSFNLVDGKWVGVALMDL